jgi:hypothetical protein
LNAEGRKAAMRSGNYQDTITTPLSREHDHDATDDNEIDGIAADLDADTDIADGVLSAIEKVCIVVFMLIDLKYSLSSFGKSSRLSIQVLNTIKHGCVRSSLPSWKEAGSQRNPAPPLC